MNEIHKYFTQLDISDIDQFAPAFKVRWDNVLALTAFSAKETLICTSQGKKVVVRQTLRETLSRFADEYDLSQDEMRALYEGKTQGYVAGRHKLVPTCGVGNKQVIYYMAHLMQEYHELVNGVMMEFVVGNVHHHLFADASYRTFKRLMLAADQAGQKQLNALKWKMHNYGLDSISIDPQIKTYQDLREWKQADREWRYKYCKNVYDQISKKEYGQPIEKNFDDRLRKLMKVDKNH